ncbi:MULTISPECIES: MFS transporter [Microbacterium]|jgi:metabolite-proton symporter|uniref:MFS transporter n=2 Tax=Microbacteriaceae TaxID=85023 RepID=UPI0006F6D3CC|nr:MULTISPECIES: MFS transporter [unclassified Microbacterium]MBN9198708.1 MHS family MFS transporter [Microbacterium ginsengisoli]MCK9917376.1 MHS family MFS transporter [Microbacteriaceae bacterium K1510]KQS02723.1 MFS transporter [Microbacterium sp. Leaf347]ODU77221.1 MAG: MFS transporter [Microbacterium sp. SCN 71-21]OJU75496.1 MAG: MFS transporter [Microbacterium sp. 71-23]
MSTAVSSAPSSAPAPANPRSRVITASLIGTTIEFYDFYAYATAAVLVFPVLFFPTGNDTASLLASFGVFGAAMVARPIGAVVFGHFGDRFGRKATLVTSLLTMGIATFLIGCLPTFNQIGVWAAVLLLILRLAQGFALGGEWSGAALVATENAPAGKRAWYGTFPQLGAPIGFIIANGVFLVINFALPHPDGGAQRSEAFLSWGWRVPFLFSAVMVIIGLWVRLRLVESETFTKAEKTGAIRKFPLGEVLRRHWWHLVLGTFIMLATYVLFYLMTSFTLSYGTKATLATASAAAQKAAEAAGKVFDPAAFAASYVPGQGFAYTDFVIMQIIGVVFFGIFTLISGPLADAIGRRKLLIWVTVGIIVFGLTFSVFLAPYADPKLTGALTQAFLVFGFVLMGSTFGPMGAILPELFPTNVRYTGSAISYNVSSILGAALAPIVAVALWAAAGGSPWLVGLYLTGCSVLTLIALLLSRETKDASYDDNIGVGSTGSL